MAHPRHPLWPMPSPSGSTLTIFWDNQHEVGVSYMGQATKDKIFNTDLTALKEADLTVALITGQDIDSGTAAEIGFTYANGKPVIAITAYERRFRNLFVDGMIAKTVNDVDEILPAISSISPKH